MKENLSLYDILEITPNASLQEIREAYLRIKAAYSRNNIALYTILSAEEGEQALKKLEEAYTILTDETKRRLYDQTYNSHMHMDTPVEENVISIDRVPPMETLPHGEELLIPPVTDFGHTKDLSQAKPPLTSPPPFSPQTDPVLREIIESETEWSGQFLKKVRNALQISIEELSTSTKIQKSYLIAIEEENYSKLPASVFVRGFVIQFAKALKLPHEKVAIAYLSRYHRVRTE